MENLDTLVEKSLAKNALGALMLGAAKLNGKSYKEPTAIEKNISSGIKFTKPIMNKEAESFLKLLVFAAHNNIKTNNERLNKAYNYIKKRFLKVNASVGDEMSKLSSYSGKISSPCYRYVEKTGDYTTGEGLAFEVLCFMSLPNTVFADSDNPTIDLKEGSSGIQCKWTSSGNWNERFGGAGEKNYEPYKPFKLASGNFKSSKLYTLSEAGSNRLTEVVYLFKNKFSKSKTRINGKTKYTDLTGGNTVFEKYNQTIRIDGDGELIVNQAFVNSKELISKTEDITSKINSSLKELKNQLTDAIKSELKSPEDFNRLFNNMNSDTGSAKQPYELTVYKKKEEVPENTSEDLKTIREYKGVLLNKKGSELDKENIIRKAMIKPEINVIESGTIKSINTADFGNTPIKRMAHTVQEFFDATVNKYDVYSFGKGTGEIKLSALKNALANSSIQTYFNY